MSAHMREGSFLFAYGMAFGSRRSNVEDKKSFPSYEVSAITKGGNQKKKNKKKQKNKKTKKSRKRADKKGRFSIKGSPFPKGVRQEKVNRGGLPGGAPFPKINRQENR